MAGDRRGVVAHAIDDAGNAVALQEHQVADAEAAHFKPISASEAALRAQADADANYVDENYGTLGKAALGAASGLTLGLGPAAATRLGMLDPGHLDAAQQSGAFTAGDIAGTLLPAFLSGGAAGASRGVVGRALAATPAGALGEAGGLAERLVGHFLPEAGLLGKTATGTIKMAARGASEGAIINAAHEASHEIIVNKPLSAQAILASGVDGALFGGLAGGVLGGGAALAGAGIESLGNSAAGALAGRGGERSGGVVVKRLFGDGEAKAAELAGREGGIQGAVKQYVDVIQQANTKLSAPTSAIRDSLKRLVAEQELVADTALKELGQIAKPGESLTRDLAARFDKEYQVMYRGTADQTFAKNVYGDLKRRLGKATEWEHWAANRDILARDVANTTGVKKDIYESALNAFDDEFRKAGSGVDEALFGQYASATSSRRIASELIDGTTKKLGSEAAKGNPLHLNGADAATGAYGLIAGHPAAAAGIVLGKKITGYIQDKLEPVIAEYAARSAIGSSAGAATASVGNRLSGALKKFVTGARVSTEKYNADTPRAPKLSYTLKSYNDNMELAEQLTSLSHQQKVRENMDALALAGHPELAQAMSETYGRAVAYVTANMPKRASKELAAGRLGKSPKPASLDTQGWKFLRQIYSMRDPVGTIVNGLEDGSLSRDAIATIKYVMPDLHADLVYRASQAIMDMKREGKFLPADKTALLGVALGYPVDSKLQKEFIAEVQQGLAANKKPQQQSGGGPPPVTDISSYQTPLQSSV